MLGYRRHRRPLVVGQRLERRVAVEVVDIEPEDFAGDFFGAEVGGEFSDAAVGVVGPAALMIAECPAGRERGATSELGVAGEDFARKIGWVVA